MPGSCADPSSGGASHAAPAEEQSSWPLLAPCIDVSTPIQAHPRGQEADFTPSAPNISLIKHSRMGLRLGGAPLRWNSHTE